MMLWHMKLMFVVGRLFGHCLQFDNSPGVVFEQSTIVIVENLAPAHSSSALASRGLLGSFVFIENRLVLSKPAARGCLQLMN